MTNRHLMHRQKLELTYSDEEQARKDLPQWGAKFWSLIFPALEEVFDELIPSHRKVRLEKLELDLGRIRRNSTSDELKKLLRDQLIEKIGITPRNLQPSSGLGEKMRFPEGDFDQLIYLIKTGRYPWWVSLSERKSMASLIQQIQKENPSQIRKWLLSKPLLSEETLRLSYHLGHKHAQKILLTTFPDSEKRLIRILQFLKTADRISGLRENLLLDFFLQKTLEQAFARQPSISGAWREWLDRQVFNPKQQAPLFPSDLADFLLLLSEPTEVRNAWTSSGEKVWSIASEVLLGKKGLAELSENKALAEAKARFIEGIEKPIPTRKRTATAISPLPLSQEKNQKLTSTNSTLEESYQIRNAGLVLAAPYFPYFFEGLGLTQNRKFINESTQHRAVLLTQALLGSTSDSEEGDLVLNKILCGVPIAQPIPLDWALSKSEQEEIINLLDSMAKNWTVLKSTSGKSMAQGFFIRTGMIREVDQGYQLEIERNSIDLLIDRLPWTFSILKLPWMNQTLFTQW